MIVALTNITFIPTSGVLDTIFHQSWLAFSLFGVPAGGYKINLIDLIIVLIIALAANAITEQLTSRKVGGLFLAVLLTIIGAYLVVAYVRLPFDFALEGVRIIAALLGAVIVAVFYTLLVGRTSGKKA
jgi:uncharacterized membrane protein YeaQ/YmgE (transglycosylase-associated protein family)